MKARSPVDDACPCGRGAPYDRCCGHFHAAHAAQDVAGMAPDPESLMRSRYTAFVRDLRPYLLATWHPRTRPADIAPPEAGLKWLGLTVQDHQRMGDDGGTVSFVARYKLGGRAGRMTECSRFVREAGVWLYVGALEDAGDPVGPDQPGEPGLPP